MTKPMLIGLHGKPRSGKDTLAAHLIQKYDLVRYGPSVPVKNATAAMFGIPRSYLDDDKMKDQVDPFWNMTYREMAQMVGKESSRDVFGEDFWMKHVEKKLKAYETDEDPPGGLILADVRYANEVEWIKAHGGDVIFVVRSNLPASSGGGHAAEQGLPLDLADIIVYNDGTISELYDSIDRKMASDPTWVDFAGLV